MTANGSMGTVFTDYLRQFEPGRSEPPREAVDTAWAALKSHLQRELRRHDLWSYPPGYLGVPGQSWWEDDALDELTCDCYIYALANRLRSLKAQLHVKPNIDGLVILNIRHFLFERRRKFDPLGYRIFTVLHEAVKETVRSGHLHILDGEAEIRNDTVLSSDPNADPSVVAADPEVTDAVTLWIDNLLPELVTANASAKRKVTEQLGECLTGLERSGLRTVRFKQIIDPLKNQVRGRWGSLFAESEDETAFEGEQDLTEIVRVVQPETGFEERQQFLHISDCVSRNIAAARVDKDKKEQLTRLWEFLRMQASADEKLPSQRALAALLGIPRRRIPPLYEGLGTFIRQCKDEQLAKSDRYVDSRNTRSETAGSV